MIKWWNKRKKSDVAWKVKVEDLKRGFDLDVKNPYREEEDVDLSATELLSRLNVSVETTRELLAELKRQIG